MSSAAATKILVIDDDKVAQGFIAKSFGAEYQVQRAMEGEEGIQLAKSWLPQLILLDVEMPGKNGFEVCKLIKSDSDTANIPVVFLSGRTGLKEKMMGFEVGGEDFLVKPIDSELLNAKVKRLTEVESQKRVLTTEVDQVRQTALDALTDSAELGKAIRFVEQISTITDFDSLAEHFFHFLREIDLKTCILVKLENFTQCFSDDCSRASPLEQELMLTLHQEKRFYDFGGRTQVNYRNIALLIKNMPVDDQVRYGRIKDLLPFVLAAADEKVRILGNEYAMRQQADKLSMSIDQVKSTLNRVVDSIKDNQESLNKSIKLMMSKLEDNIPRMGLDDDQEAFIINTVDDTIVETGAFIDESLSMRNSLNSVIRLLNYLNEEQKKLISDAVNNKKIADKGHDSSQESSIKNDKDNVQLF